MNPRSPLAVQMPARKAAALVPVAALCLLALPGQRARALETTPACHTLTLTSATATTTGDVRVFATAPADPGSATSTFSVTQDGKHLRVVAERLSSPAVAVVLAAGASTPAADYAQARLAAHELLLGLPDGARTSFLSGSGPARVLSPLSQLKGPAAAAISQLDRPQGARTATQAVQLAVNELPAAGHVVLLDDSTDKGDPGPQQVAMSALASRGVTLDRIGYGPAAGAISGTLAGDVCTASTVGQNILSRVDSVVDRLSRQYRLDIAGVRSTSLTVSTENAGGGARATLVVPAAVARHDGVAPVPLQMASRAPLAGAARPVDLRWSAGWTVTVALLVLAVLALGAIAVVVAIRRRRRRQQSGWSTEGVSRGGSYGGTFPATTGGGGVSLHRGRGVYPDVDVAIVQESTYPYLKGGVSAVVHDIVTGNQDLTFGIIHITWDSTSPSEDLYGMPKNVKWVRPVYLSMAEHQEDFSAMTPDDLGMSGAERAALSARIFDALRAILDGHMEPMWQLYDEGMNPRTRTYPLWAVFGSQEFMTASRQELPTLGLPLVATFWLLREFFSLACAILGGDLPKAGVYHAHTTGYAALLSAAAARQNGTKFLLTEHNLYVRDTVNFMLERSMALTLKVNDWREFDVPATERAWMAWWIEMGRFCYPSAEAITFLYPKAISEAADLGAPVEKAIVIPNGMIVRDFEGVSQQRQQALGAILADDPTRVWRLVYIARVVPIKGLADLIGTVALLVERGITNFHLDILGPTDHHPAYYMLCREKARTLRVEDYLTFRGTVNVRELLGEFDMLVLPSYNEGQPIVVLEAMTAGIPTVGTEVGGMAQLIDDPLTTPGGHTWGPCGLLVQPDYVVGIADALQTLMRDPAMYAAFATNARGRVADFFQLEDTMGAYNRLYRELGGLEQVQLEGASAQQSVHSDGLHRSGSHRIVDAPADDRIIDLTDGNQNSPLRQGHEKH